ncbi:MAG TPA: cytochrome c-type biogenesis protein CcmH [Terriglobia bacterium]|jgi:cytochrome c-type biogenesis protein CcmH
MFRYSVRIAPLVFLLLLTSVGLTADRNERMRELTPKFMCVCGGCNQVLMNCNHIGCPSREAMLKDIGNRVDQGTTDDGVVEYFIDKYGTSVLSAPPASGFNLAAWVMPFAALGIGLAAAIFFLRRFRSLRPNEPAAPVDLAQYKQKVEEELKKFTPED